MPSHEALQIAVVEDDPIMGESLLQRLALEGYDARWYKSGGEALAQLRTTRPHLLLCDIRLPDMSGEEIFRAALPELRFAPVMFMTAFGDIEQAVRLMRAGADDYVIKPFQMDEFLGRIDHLLKRRGIAEGEEKPVLGQSEAMRRIEAVLRRVVDIESTLLLTGESGVGKEVAARFVHEISSRSGKPFVAVNCAAIPADLLESELFGHEKGAFTGAVARHEGYAERARDGVLFLDEIGELQPGLQAKLLRMIQERQFLRVGGERLVEFRARLICSSNADLEKEAEAGRFRRDLYYRVNVIAVKIPPLRERREDISALLAGYIAQFAESFHTETRGASTLAEDVALVYHWPGNVRELRNRAERAVALARGPWIGAADLFPDLVPQSVLSESASAVLPLAAVRDEAERRHIAFVLERTGGQMKQAAELLGVSRTTLWEKMRRLGVPESH
jgi:DNA-binding NtrC family response regulator